MNYVMIAGAIVIAISAANFTRSGVASWVDVKCIVSKTDLSQQYTLSIHIISQ